MCDVDKPGKTDLVKAALVFPELRRCEVNGIGQLGKGQAYRFAPKLNANTKRDIKRIWRAITPFPRGHYFARPSAKRR